MSEAGSAPVSRMQAFREFGKIGLLSFGGPAAQIALMHRILVDERGWLGEKQFLNALSFCMLLPGPEAMQLATYAGWRLHGLRGGLMAGLLFVLPGAAVVLVLSALYAVFGNVPLVETLFIGIKAAVLVVVLEALLRVSKRALKYRAHWIIAALAFIGIFFFSIPFPLIILFAAAYGFIATASSGDAASPSVTVSARQTALTVLIWLAIWLVPVAGFLVFSETLLGEVGVFFSKLAVVTFGGAYAVLAYMAQDVVTGLGWLTAGEMLDGLGLAETTPGPLILVTEFVGFLAAFKQGGMGLALTAAALTLWVTFAPCFLWIFAAAPYVEWIAAQQRLSGALAAITAAVVGVILNLSVWFGLHVLFGDVAKIESGMLTLWLPDLGSIDWRVCLITLLAAIALLRLHVNVVLVLAGAALAGWLLTLV